MKTPTPTRREEIALFRLSVVGDLLAFECQHGELITELKARARRRYRPPGAARTRTYHWKTLQRWYYQAKKDPSAGLLPESRSRGYALKLSVDQREMLLKMRRENPSAAAELLRSEAIRHKLVAPGQLSLPTLRRLFAAHGLPRVSKRRAERNDVQRRRWEAAAVCDLWHGDVCHLILADDEGKPRRVLVHALIDDASRYVVALEARKQEREVDLLEVLCAALMKYPPPKVLYFDQGSCYRGSVLPLVCQRLGIRLVHATPGNPQAGGTRERFFRTMRQRCTDHLPLSASLHGVQQALWAFLDVDYHRRPHAGLMGHTPRRRFQEGRPRSRRPLEASELARALEVTEPRKVRRDATFVVDGAVYEVSGRHLAGRSVDVTQDALTGRVLRVVADGKSVRFGACDPVANGRRRRPADAPTPEKTTAFDPIAALLQDARELTDGE